MRFISDGSLARRRISRAPDVEVTSTMAGALGAVLACGLAWESLALLAPSTPTDAAIGAFAVAGAVGFAAGTAVLHAWRRSRLDTGRFRRDSANL
jgi:predicted CDP-diglyceride synthetase/phosphatidate cytidylyltransferase